MQKEKLVAIALVIIIIGAIVSLLFVAYGGDIWNNLFGSKESQVLARDDSLVAYQNSVNVITGILGNDKYSNITSYQTQVQILSQASNGIVNITDDNKILYIPNINFSGNDSFVYEIIDENGQSSQATATIQVKLPGTIALGDCVDISYIGRYCSNDTIFDSSYNDTTNRTGGAPLNVFVSFNKTQEPPTGFATYSQGIIDGLMEGLIGLKEGDNVTMDPIPPEKAYGFKPKIGDILNFTPLAGYPYVLKFVEIQENMSMPSDYQSYFGNVTTTLYTLKEDWHYIGEIIDNYTMAYPFWKDSSVVTGVNDTLLWMYVTPSTGIGEVFTYFENNETDGTLTTYPENTSSISFINDTIINVTHNPEIGTTIDVSAYYPGYGYYSVGSYTVESLTADKINVSITDSTTGDTTYMDLDRTITIQRNQTRNITQPAIPGELVESYLLSYLRDSDSTFKLSYLPLSDETLCFEVRIENVYKIS